MQQVIIDFDTKSVADYQKFLQCKRLPIYDVRDGRVITNEDSYNIIFKKDEQNSLTVSDNKLFDYQEWVINRALKAKRFASYLDCGLGKTAILLYWLQEVSKMGKALLLCPLQVLDGFMADAQKFGIKTNITNLRKTNLQWSEGIGILNYEYARDVNMKGVAGIALDESSILKNGDGATRNWLCSLARGIEYRIAASATPSPNDQAEYANQAVFLGLVNSSLEFYSKFFRKQENDWILKGHSVGPFYEYMATFSCYIHNPNKLGFECGGYISESPEYIENYIPENMGIYTQKIIQDSVSSSEANVVFARRADTDTERFRWCVEMAESCKSIVWCKRNTEEKAFLGAIKNSVLITGETPAEKRVELIAAWRNGDINTLISKPPILGWGVNLPEAEGMVFSGYDFSMESFYQAVRRSHRYPRVGRLKVFIPVTLPEVPIYETLKNKTNTMLHDIEEMQKRFNAL
jgi:hypothetical protein